MESVEELARPPGNRLHGDREGQWSISIDGKYRICFRFDDYTGDAHEVEATDYH